MENFSYFERQREKKKEGRREGRKEVEREITFTYLLSQYIVLLLVVVNHLLCLTYKLNLTIGMYVCKYGKNIVYLGRVQYDLRF